MYTSVAAVLVRFLRSSGGRFANDAVVFRLFCCVRVLQSGV